MQAKDYYAILGVAEDADAAALKKAFRKIARDSHPDTHPGDAEAEARFKEASEAYEVLNDPEKRRKYDALRRYGVGSGPGGANFEDLFGGGGFPGGPGGGFRVHINRGDLHDMDFADIFNSGSPFSELFEQLFAGAGVGPGQTMGGRARARSARRPAFPHLDDRFFRQDGLDVHCTVWLRVDQLEKGAKVKVRTPSGGKAIVNVPAGTAIGTVLRLPGQGLAFGGKRGDQFVHIEGVA